MVNNLRDFVVAYGPYTVKDGRLVSIASLGKKAVPILIRKVK